MMWFILLFSLVFFILSYVLFSILSSVLLLLYSTLHIISIFYLLYVKVLYDSGQYGTIPNVGCGSIDIGTIY